MTKAVLTCFIYSLCQLQVRDKEKNSRMFTEPILVSVTLLLKYPKAEV